MSPVDNRGRRVTERAGARATLGRAARSAMSTSLASRAHALRTPGGVRDVELRVHATEPLAGRARDHRRRVDVHRLPSAGDDG